MENKRIFDIELEKLNQKIIQMCSQVNKQVKDAIAALKENNLDLARAVIIIDNDINSLEIKIDKLCQKIFALQQPVASDLRFIMSALKINNDLERIGDHAVSIAKRISALEDFPELVPSLGVSQVGDKVHELFEIMLELVHNRNLNLNDEIFRQAASVKEECRTVSDKILAEMMQKTEVIAVATILLEILNHTERIAGYITNIAESITFVVEGEIIKHRKNQ